MLRRLLPGPAAAPLAVLFLFLGPAAWSIAGEPVDLDRGWWLIGEERFDEAEALGREALRAAEAAHGADSLEAAAALDLLVGALSGDATVKSDETLDLVRRAVAVREGRGEGDGPTLAGSLHRLAYVLHKRGEDEDALAACRRALDIREEALAPVHQDIGSSLYLLGRIEGSLGNYPEAMAHLDGAREVWEKALGSRSLEVADAAYRFARIAHYVGDQQGAREKAEQALAIREEELGTGHPRVADVLQVLSAVWLLLGDYDRAISLGERTLAIRETAYGPIDERVAKTLNNLGLALQESGHHERARALLERALAVRRELYPAGHVEVAKALGNVGLVLQDMGRYREALAAYEESDEILEKALGPEHPSVALGQNLLAILLLHMGDYARAEELHHKALATREKIFGPGHPLVAQSLVNLGIVEHRLARYASARSHIERSLEIFDKTLGPDHPARSIILNALANLLHDMDEHAEVVRLYEAALAAQEKAVGRESPKLLIYLVNLTSELREAGDPGRARVVIARAQAIAEKELDPDHPLLADILETLARLRFDEGNALEGIRLQERVLEIRKKTLGEGHPRVADALDVLAEQHEGTGGLDRARPLLESALRVRQESLGPGHPVTVATASRLATVQWMKGRDREAFDLAMKSWRAWTGHTRLVARALPETEALRYVAQGISSPDLALSYATTNDEALGQTWEEVIRSRALVLDEMAARHRSLAGSSEPEVVAREERLLAAAQRLANLTVRGPGDDEPEVYLELLAQAKKERDRTERDLLERSAAFRARQAGRGVGLEEVSAALPRGAALVSFARYDRYPPVAPAASGVAVAPPAPEPSYLGFVLRGGGREPDVVPLGPAAGIDALVQRWAQEAARGAEVPGRSAREAEAAYREAASALRRAVWDPVTPLVGKANLVFVVPDGSLHRVNFATLPATRGRYLIEKGPLIHYLSAERDLATSGPRAADGEGLLAMGAPAFDDGSLFASQASRNEPEAGLVARAASLLTFRGERSSCGDFQDLAFVPLPHSRREVEDVAALWQADGQRANVPRMGVEANEAALKAEAPGKRVLHLATHGFFLEGRCPSALDRGRRSGPAARDDLPHASVMENPLLLTGLALAGANRRDAAGPREEDGILTAEEVAALDLSAVELAVLSACGTGLGEIRSGEGVLGLRRAFRVAGATTLVTSLWAVDDEATREWMRGFYSARYKRGLRTAESVREASRGILRSARRGGESTHPFYWGGFVASGEWR